MNRREGLSSMAPSQVTPEGSMFLQHLEVSLARLLLCEALSLGARDFFFFCSEVSRDFLPQNISRAKGCFDALASKDRSEEWEVAVLLERARPFLPAYRKEGLWFCP